MKNNPWFVCDTPNPHAQLNLFCFHHAGGSALAYRQWQKYLSSLVNVISIQLPGRDQRYAEPFARDLSVILKSLTRDPNVFKKPFLFFGHSLGAMLAYELARTLQAQQLPTPQTLMVSGSVGPARFSEREKLYHLPDQGFIARIYQKYGGFEGELQNSPEFIEFILPRLRADIYLAENYHYVHGDKLNCPVVVLGGKQDLSVSDEGLLVWQQETKSIIRCYKFEGHHFFIESNKRAIFDIIHQSITRETMFV